MKKFFLFLFALTFLASCKSTVDTKSQVGIKGNWTLTDVSYDGSSYFNVKSFQIADAKCFEGSQWSFVSNNNKGTMELAKAGCPSASGDFMWTITPDQQFTLKFVGEGDKAKKVTAGFVLRVQNQTATSFELVDTANIGGKTTNIVYHFNKN